MNQRKHLLLKQQPRGNAGSHVVAVPLVVKGDVWGSVEALIGILKSKQPSLMKLDIVHTGVGGVTDSDIDMAVSTGGTYSPSSNLTNCMLYIHTHIYIHVYCYYCIFIWQASSWPSMQLVQS